MQLAHRLWSIHRVRRLRDKSKFWRVWCTRARIFMRSVAATRYRYTAFARLSQREQICSYTGADTCAPTCNPVAACWKETYVPCIPEHIEAENCAPELVEISCSRVKKRNILGGWSGREDGRKLEILEIVLTLCSQYRLCRLKRISQEDVTGKCELGFILGGWERSILRLISMILYGFVWYFIFGK